MGVQGFSTDMGQTETWTPTGFQINMLPKDQAKVSGFRPETVEGDRLKQLVGKPGPGLHW